MKQVNFVKKCAYGMFCTLATTSILLISSCQKDATPAPETVPSSAFDGKLKASFAATTKSAFVKTAAITYTGKSGITIRGDSISGGSLACIHLINCTNIHITRCKLTNSTTFGIFVENSSNILIDSCLITNVMAGIYVKSTTQMRVMSNQMQNMKGPYPHADFIQFNGVYGTFNRICYNKLENISGKSNAEDGINTYMSSGTATDNLYIIGNEIRGGGPSTTGAGICMGDNGGSYQTAENNILVNSGYGGIDCAGGTHMQILNNTVYSSKFSWSGFGLCSANYSPSPSSSNTMTGNKVYWIAGMWGGYERDTVFKYATGSKANPTPAGWRSNTIHASITSSILPATLIDYK